MGVKNKTIKIDKTLRKSMITLKLDAFALNGYNCVRRNNYLLRIMVNVTYISIQVYHQLPLLRLESNDIIRSKNYCLKEQIASIEWKGFTDLADRYQLSSPHADCKIGDP